MTQRLDPLEINTVNVLSFLQDRLDKDASRYGTFNNHRAALSFLKPGLGEDREIKRFLKGVARLRPPRAKYGAVWDPSEVLTYLASLHPYENMGLKDISQKLATLLVLCTGQRVQTISVIRLTNIKVSDKGIQIFINERIKTTNVNKPQPCFSLPIFNENPELCVARLLLHYMDLTKPIRKEEEFLFLSTRQPHKRASKDTIARWIKDVLKKAGVNTEIFSAHSTRHASTSAALRKGVPLDLVRQSAGWSNNSQVFARFYNRPLVDNTFINTICGI